MIIALKKISIYKLHHKFWFLVLTIYRKAVPQRILCCLRHLDDEEAAEETSVVVCSSVVQGLIEATAAALHLRSVGGGLPTYAII